MPTTSSRLSLRSRFLACAAIVGLVAIGAVVWSLRSRQSDELVEAEDQSLSNQTVVVEKDKEKAAIADSASGQNERVSDSGDKPTSTKDPTPEAEPKPDADSTQPKEGGDSPEPEKKKEDEPPDPRPKPKAPNETAPAIKLRWHDILESKADPPPFEETCFESFDLTKALPDKDEIQKWFEPVKGQKSRFFEEKTRVTVHDKLLEVLCAQVDGLVRFKAPFRDDTAIRMSMVKYKGLRIHFFSGDEGVSLIYYEPDVYRWGGYATTRKPGQPKPDTFALTATDENRNARTEIRYGGSYELRHQKGEVILSRGDVVLVRLPLAEKPDEVFFEGRAGFYGLTMIRSGEIPEPTPAFPIRSDINRPSDLEWHEQLAEGATLERLEDGSLLLSRKDSKGASSITTSLPKRGLSEVILELDEVQPGTGIIFRQSDGAATTSIGFAKNNRSGNTCLSINNMNQAGFGDVGERLVPCCRSKIWVKLLSGQSMLRSWISADGEHWAEAIAPLSLGPGGCNLIGLQVDDKHADAKIKLNRITLRKLPKLSSLVDEKALARALPFLESPTFESWKVAVIQSRPLDITLNDWTLACAVKALGVGTGPQIGSGLIDLFLDNVTSIQAPAEKQIALLSEAALLLDARNNNTLIAFIQRFHRLGMDLFRDSNNRPFSFVRPALMNASFSSRGQPRLADEAILRVELLQLLYAQQWSELLDFCRLLRFYHLHKPLPLVPWAEYVARGQTPGEVQDSVSLARRNRWQHPFDAELSKDVYNIVAELRALLESDAPDEVARTLVALDSTGFHGVAPYGNDSDLYVSLTAAVRLAMRESPELRKTIQDEYLDLAQLRIREALARGDADAVKLAAALFEATPAAAEAHQWLGDRALSSGWFGNALAEYQRAQKTARASQKSELASRVRLAGAMSGQEIGEPVTRAVQLGDTRFEPEQFESLINDMLSRPASTLTGSGVSNDSMAVPPPSGFEIHKRSRLDGRVGNKPEDELIRHAKRYSVDWANQQIAVVTSDDTVFVNNRFQVAAYDATSGERKWQSQQPPGDMLRSQDWGLTKMHPLVHGDFIYARQLFGPVPLLVCLERETGKIVWTNEQYQNEMIVSDPMLLRDRLVVLTLLQSHARQLVLRLATIAPESGKVLQQQEIIRLRESWRIRKFCAAIALDDGFISSLGGIVICCDVNGDVRWIRRQTILPIDEEHTSAKQHFQTPRLFDGKLYVTQPGIRMLQCIDPDTGRVDWSSFEPNLQRLVGVTNDRVVLQTDEGFVGLDRAAGEVVWRYNVGQLLDAQICDENHSLVFSKRIPLPSDPARFLPQLVWLDSQTGIPQATTDLSGLDDPDPLLGAMVATKEKLFAFFGRGYTDPNRDLVELLASGTATRSASYVPVANLWNRKIDPVLRNNAIATLSDWTLLSGSAPSAADQDHKLAIEATAGSSVIFAREVVVPDTDQPRLRISVGFSTPAKNRIAVFVDGKSLWDDTVTAKFPEQPGRNLDVDLSSLSGKNVWITVRAQCANPGEPLTTFWEHLSIVP